MKKLNLKIKDMPYAAEEALNRLRVNIKFCGKNTKKIVITSSVPNEGKSTVSVRLWKLLSEAGFPTVLVDVDLEVEYLPLPPKRNPPAHLLPNHLPIPHYWHS